MTLSQLAGGLLLKKLKHFEVMLSIFKFLQVWEYVESWLVYANNLFWIAQPYLSTYIIQVSASLFFLLLKLLMKKNKNCYSATALTVSLYALTKLKKIKLFYLHCFCEILLSNQVRGI